jgi:hypothetical protein
MPRKKLISCDFNGGLGKSSILYLQGLREIDPFRNRDRRPLKL